MTFADEEVLETAGRYRVVLFPDLYPEQPYDEGSGPVLRIDRRGSQAEHVDSGKWRSRDKILYRIADETERLLAVYDKRKALLILQRWLRAFYGVTRFETWDSDDYTYIAYDPSVWRQEIGAPQGSVGLEDWKCWVLGEVYCYAVQRRVKWKKAGRPTRPVRTPPGLIVQERLETWEPTDDACGGFYGYEYAKEAALEALAAARK